MIAVKNYTHHVYKVLRGIKNLFTWFFVIWGDRNWDYEFLYIILRKKLELMRDDQIKNSVEMGYVGQEFTIRDLNICINILKKIQVNDGWFDTNEKAVLWLRKKKIVFNYEKDLDLALFYANDLMSEKGRKLVFKIMGEKSTNWWT